MQIKVLDERGIPYIIKETKAQKIAIEVKNDGMIIIKRNRFINNNKVNIFIEEHLPWIEKAYLKHYQPPRRFISGEDYLLLGKTFQIRLITADFNKAICDIEHGTTIDIYTKNREFKTIEKIMDKYLQELASTIFNILLENALKQTNRYFESRPQLYIKHYKSRWGCCIPKENKIVLNLALIHVDIDLIMYVIFHELCHMQYLNHSSDFHHLLQEFVPNEKDLRKRLNKYSATYR